MHDDAQEQALCVIPLTLDRKFSAVKPVPISEKRPSLSTGLPSSLFTPLGYIFTPPQPKGAHDRVMIDE